MGERQGEDVRQRTLAVLTAAFVADPVVRWLLPDSATYLEAFPQLAGLMCADGFTAGTVDVAGPWFGAAVWLAPDASSDEDAIGTLFEATTADDRLEEVFEFLIAIQANHPEGEIWYLPFVGVDPMRQGQGLGAELVKAGLARADADGLPAYLEASSPRNRALYERHGFEVVGEIRTASSPVMWPMLRPPGGGR